jgi:hypothetical protein
MELSMPYIIINSDYSNMANNLASNGLPVEYSYDNGNQPCAYLEPIPRSIKAICLEFPQRLIKRAVIFHVNISKYYVILSIIMS